MAPTKSKTNGVTKGETNGKHTKTSAAQPTDLDEQDRERLKEWLDRTNNPFNVTISSATRKRKRDEDMHLEEGLLVKDLQVLYEVKPRDKWESLRRYKKFTVGSESIATGQCILVKHDEATEDMRMESEAQWKAQVLEVRALDSEHVYIRVAWLNRPEDLESGRKSYHGKHELIVSNQMDIIDAMSVNGTLDVVALDDKDDDSAEIEDQYFWRQTYDLVTRKYSELRKICRDKVPANPDQIIIQCSRESCRQWLHVKCLAEDALREHENGAKKTKRELTTPPKNEANEEARATPTAYAENKKKTVASEVYLKGEPHGANDIPATKSEIVVTPKGGEAYAQDLYCLLCHEPIEDDT
ncbi:hypothetical protein CB0940_04761 [Cercospora beticola]|uniref:BAH domain-containing protein n=1 Tax=Cercospora beticola TaxID=122368 RepID=A0A2G5HLW0_CERBT|nr:hypothetical protein CB0940_04761 [Cercospora beticola]PIA93515.1 hypothetical protein CB0940_04761 [Cercospora beticola]WPB02026.1 hypothetical protein RHO25_006660 [Cercospora beticola]